MKLPDLESNIAPLLRQLKWTLSLAESCTGGLISHRITNIAGASDYYLGGINAYTNEAKHNLLRVQNETLKSFGAVSEQTVREMVNGAKQLFHSDCAIAVSGIAGPGGGSPQKPVGTVWIGLASADTTTAHCYRFFGERLAIKNQSAELALWLLFQELQQHIHQPPDPQITPYYHPLAVNYSYAADGTPQIHAFNWQEKDIQIVSSGRQWEDELGWHVLVMDIKNQVFELLERPDGRWYLRPPHELPHIG